MDYATAISPPWYMVDLSSGSSDRDSSAHRSDLRPVIGQIQHCLGRLYGTGVPNGLSKCRGCGGKTKDLPSITYTPHNRPHTLEYSKCDAILRAAYSNRRSYR
jgi:hypothetical protein